MAGIETPKISMGTEGFGVVGGVGSARRYFQRAHLVSALVVNTSSPGSFFTIL